MFKSPQIEEVSPQAAAGLREQGSVLLDVREPHEWAAGHAPDAVHVPLGDVKTSAARFVGREVLIVCRSGARSAKAATTLAEAGIAVRNVTGGMTAWVAAGLPLLTDDGAHGTVA